MLKHVLKRGVSRVETEVDPRRKYLLLEMHEQTYLHLAMDIFASFYLLKQQPLAPERLAKHFAF